ncbi:TPA: hypothetical protein N0F65_012573 [Lagenidium giganteum]|uniref:YHYH domain-containing protein n=1 Tax=Lagenidium giganteum TaxID=4803 RepID=A0AAV2YPS0_9STRA|nr:TPA: hypothetical protein N0F65_012573 [Lagenidium giganteum]
MRRHGQLGAAGRAKVAPTKDHDQGARKGVVDMRMRMRMRFSLTIARAPTGAAVPAMAQLLLLLLLAVVALSTAVLAIQPIPQAADILTVVNVNTAKDVRLDANIYIPDGGEVLLNVDVPIEAIEVDAQGPAKVVRVYSNHSNGVFGVGEQINVFVEFTGPVDVVGTPALELQTGCHASACHTREVQRLRCRGTAGKFAVGFNGQSVRNIPWDATPKQFASFLQRMTQIDVVLVDYNIANAACSFFGNNITVTFESVNIVGADGDLPALTADPANTQGDGTVLSHVRFDPTLTTTAWELQKGQQVPNRVATFVQQTAPNALMFSYMVQQGDNATLLEYASSDSLKLPSTNNGAQVVNTGTNVVVDLSLPPPGSKGNWEIGLGSSLSANSALQIDVTPPRIISVTSTHVDGTFGIGELIVIQVVFSQPVVVTGQPTLVLETGLVDRIVPFTRALSSTVVEFNYIVQAKDTTPDLSYTGPTALQLNGGLIKRQSTTPTTDAVLTLPNNGETGSLAVNRNIVIDTSDPKVKNVVAINANGVYTAGDTININVVFDTPVVVTGSPTLTLSTGSVDLFPGFPVYEATPLGTKTIIFPEVNHGLSTAGSQGLQFLIDTQVMTVASVSGNVVTMVETYQGTLVDPTLLNAAAVVPIKSPGYRQAVYMSGSGTNTLLFAYTIQRGDVTTQLAYTSTTALQLNGGSIQRQSTTPTSNADLTLPTAGLVGSLTINSAIVVNTNVPQVLRADPITRDGVYRAGDDILFQLVFDLPVVVNGAASVLIVDGAMPRVAVYDSGSGSTTLVFRFKCQPQDQMAVFDYVDSNSLYPSYGEVAGWIRRKSAAPLTPVSLALPAGGLSSKGIAIDQNCAFVSSIMTLHEDDTVGAGEVVDVVVVYSAAVDVVVTNGVPTLLMASGKAAVYTSGTGTTSLVFRYTVQANDANGQSTHADIFALQLNGGNIVLAGSGTTRASTILPLPATSALVQTNHIMVNTAPPVVQAVSTRTLDGVLTVGDRVIVQVQFDNKVTVMPAASGLGTPVLLLNVGTGSGVTASLVTSEADRVFFAYTFVAGQSATTLAYFSRSALRCVGGVGLNQDATQDAQGINVITSATRVFAAWSEKKTGATTAQIRVRSFDVQRLPPVWTIEDGGAANSVVNFDPTMDATNAVLEVLTTTVYLVWQEQSANANNPTQIRVAKYNSPPALQRWTFVDKNPASTIGINKDATQSASLPAVAQLSGKLYVAWQESIATATAAQIRIAVYNGQDNPPAWTFVDGNSATRGLNYDGTKAASRVRIHSCGSLGATTLSLYAAWEEIGANGAVQVRVAVQAGTDAAPRWTFVDGNVATGLNVDKTMDARMPSLACWKSQLILAWTEPTALANAVARVRVRQFNGNLASPAWTALDSGVGINLDSTKNAANVRLRVRSVDDSLFAVWSEVDARRAKMQVRAARYLGSGTTWNFLDGGDVVSQVNDDVTRDATQVTATFGGLRDSVFVFWQEVNANAKAQIRASVYREPDLTWLSLVHSCIRRKSTTPTTPVSLLLPRLGSPGSLDFGRSIRVDTSVPIIQRVMLHSEAPAVMTAVSTVQSLDVLYRSSITQGQFQLRYDRYLTGCIDWNAAAQGANSIKAALEGISAISLSVTVSKDTSAFIDGHRYLITFVFPSYGVQPLALVTPDAGVCTGWTCAQTPAVACSIAARMQLNPNTNVPLRTGAVDVGVQFSFPVAVTTGVPALVLETGAIDRSALYTTRSATQYFDVGVNSPSPVLRGEFRLAYGDFSVGGPGFNGVSFTTDCIDISGSDEDAVEILGEKLAVVRPLTTIGIRSISRRRWRNGFRYTIEMRNSADLLDIVPADFSTCRPFSGRTQTIDVRADVAIVQGEISIGFADADSPCIPWNLRATGVTNSMTAVLSTIDTTRVLPVLVMKDPSMFTFGHRYYIDFLLLDDALELLTVSTGGACATFQCDDGNGGVVACPNLKVQVNADFVVTRATTDTLEFQYQVQSPDMSSSLMYRDSVALTGNIFRASMTTTLAVSLALPPPFSLLSPRLGRDLMIVSTGAIPTITTVTCAANAGTYTAGDLLPILVSFTSPVTVEGSPILELSSSGRAVFYSGSNSATLEFRYKVKPQESSTDLNYASIYALRVPDAWTRVRGVVAVGSSTTSLDANIWLPAVASAASLASSSAIVVDTTAPTILSVTSTRPNTVAGGLGYGVGDFIDIIVEFSQEVTVTGTPTIALNSGGSASFTYGGYRQLIDVGVYATYPITSGQFVVQYGGLESSCINFDDATSLQLRLLEFAAVQRIGIASVTKTALKNGNRFEIIFQNNQVLDAPSAIGVRLSDVCAPLLPAADSPEVLIMRSTDRFVAFNYVVGVGESATVLNHAATAIDLSSGATIQRRAKSPIIAADVTLPTATGTNALGVLKSIKTDGTPIQIVDIVADSAPDTYGVGYPPIASPATVAPGEILFHIVFSRAVTVVGAPTVELATGSLQPNGGVIPNRLAVYAGQPLPTQVAFRYRVQEGDVSLNLGFPNPNVLAQAQIYCITTTSSYLAQTTLPRLVISPAPTPIVIDAYSVPTTVMLSSNHVDGTFGVGEAIQITVDFSKEVIIQNGLNTNKDAFARYPAVLETAGNIYVLWTEWATFPRRTTSLLYLNVFSSATMAPVTLANPGAINRFPNTFIERAVLVAWSGQVYAAWDENSLIYCAVFNGFNAVNPWTLIPNMGANRVLTNPASSPLLIVHNQLLVLIWIEQGFTQSGARVGQVRVAQRNADLDAPLWIFHDGNRAQTGLNVNPLMDARDPSAVVYRGSMYLAWSELTATGSYVIVVARRYVTSRDVSTWRILTANANTNAAYSFISAHRPKLVVRRRGIEDRALLIAWHRDTLTANVSQVMHGQVNDADWAAAGTLGIPAVAANFTNTTTAEQPDALDVELLTCGDTMFAAWAQVEDATDPMRARNIRMAQLTSSGDIATGWTFAPFASGSLNHNTSYDQLEVALICSSATGQVGLSWTEFDGISTKLRLRHQAIVVRPGDLLAETAQGFPLLKLATGTVPPGIAVGVDRSGTRTHKLSFMYLVQAGHTAADLDALNQQAFVLNGAMPRDYLGQPPDCTLFPRSSDLRSLSFNKNLVINTVRPVVTSVTSTTASGEYGVGEVMTIQVVFSAPVAVLLDGVSAVPSMFLRTDELHFFNPTDNPATYVSGSGTTTLAFLYTSRDMDYCNALDYMSAGALVLNGNNRICRNASYPTQDALLTLPNPRSAGSLSSNRVIGIKPTQPRVVQVTSSNADGTYSPGDSLLIQVTFTLPVMVFGVPVILLQTNRPGAQAVYVSGSGSLTITFQYDVQPGDSTPDLAVVDDRNGDLGLTYVLSLQLVNDAQIKRKSTNPVTDAVVALPAPGQPGSLSVLKAIVLDSTRPQIISVRSTTPDGTYDVGDTIEFLIDFSRAVVVSQTPRLVLNLVLEYRQTAMYVSGSGTSTLRFLYTPQSGDNTGDTPLDYLDRQSFVARQLQFGSEIIKPPSQVFLKSTKPILAANVTLPRPGVPLLVNAPLSLVGNGKKIYVRTDGLRVQQLRADVGSGVFSPGQRIVISVVFTDVVVIQGSPRLKLNANTAVYASYLSGSGTPSLQFLYIVATGDSSQALEVTSTTALELSGGVITDAQTTYVPLRLPGPFTPGSLSFAYTIGITSQPPVVQRVYCVNRDGDYGVGDTLQVAVRFSRMVTIVTATPPTLSLQLVGGGVVRAATYASGDKSLELVFTIVVQAGDSSVDLEYAGTAALQGAVFALATTPTLAATTTLPAPGSSMSLSAQSNIRVVSSAPTVIAVSAVDRNGTYGLMDRIRLRVRFSFRVVLDPAATPATCTLKLALGNNKLALAQYAGGAKTYVLEFTYTVSQGDQAGRLDYTDTGSLSCAILQFSATPSLAANNQLPSPGSDGSLGLSSEIRIDATVPRVVSVTSPLANGIYGAGQTIDILVTFSEPVTLAGVSATPQLKLAIASNTNQPWRGPLAPPLAQYVSGASTNTLAFRYVTAVGDVALPLEYDGVDSLSVLPRGSAIVAVANLDRSATLRLPMVMATGSLSNNRDIRIDTTEPPRVIAVGSPTADGTYTVGDTVRVSITFNAPVVVVNTPVLKLVTQRGAGATVGLAQYVAGSGTPTLMFDYAVQSGDAIDRVEYTRCPDTERRPPQRREWDKVVICSQAGNALQLPAGASIKRLATTPITDAVLDLPEVTPWPELRIATPRTDFVYVNELEATTGMLPSELSLFPPLSNQFSISQQKSSIYIYSNGVPDHPTSLMASKTIKEQRYFIELRRFPVQQSNPLQLQMFDGFTGIFLNGIPFKNASAVAAATATVSPVPDECGGAVDSTGRYFYLALPVCFLDQASLQPPIIVPGAPDSPPPSPSPLLGYAFDGYAIYGFNNELGNLPVDLDACNGRIGADGTYRYHLVPPWSPGNRPLFPPCLKGVDAQSDALVRVFRFPVDIRQVEALSLPQLSRLDGLVVDENPDTQRAASVWLNPKGVSVTYTSSAVLVRSTGVPDGAFGPFPNDYNPYQVKTQNYEFQFPRQPVVNPTGATTPLPQDVPVGVMLNGVPFFSYQSAVYGANVMASTSPAMVLFDKCKGLVDSGGNYRYYDSPDCLLSELSNGSVAAIRNQTLIGYAFDGFPVYGPFTERGVAPTDLDVCNGRYGDDGTYRYHVTPGKAPFLIGCYRGVPLTASNDVFRSLSYGHALQLNTDVPQVVQVFTSKRPGRYVAGETLDLVLRWSWPVVIDTTLGLPTVVVQNAAAPAVYNAAKSTPGRSVFVYSVTTDRLDAFNYDTRSSITLNGATIRRQAVTPQLAAALSLVGAEKTSRFASKHQLVQDVRIVLRGLYHPHASDLVVRLFHEQRNALVFTQCCGADAFGQPDDHLRINRAQIDALAANPTSGVGIDYSFQDFTFARNLARDGGATTLQSSTSSACVAGNAVDGDVNGFVSKQNVARTQARPNENSWWELRLLRSTVIGTIRIWLPQPERLPAIVQTLRVDSADGQAPVMGSFVLAFTRSDGQVLTTDPIAANAVAMQSDEDQRVPTAGIGQAESIQAKLWALPGMPRVFITRTPGKASLSPNGAFTWSITFLDNPRVPEGAVPLAVAVNNVCNGLGVVALTRPLPGDDSDPWTYQDVDNHPSNATVGTLSMLPFWVFLFDDTAVLDFETLQDAYDTAVWSYRVDALVAKQFVSLGPPPNLTTQAIRIVAANTNAVLTLAEVEVFQERNHVLSQYTGGTPIVPVSFPSGETWSPEDSFRATFASMASEGTWTLSLTDVAPAAGGIHGAGAISDWQLIVTNFAGITRTYHMDVRAQLQTLPRHGKLYVAINETEHDHLDADMNGILDSVEATAYLSRYWLSYDLLAAPTRQRVLTAFLDGYASFGGIQVLSDASQRERLMPVACDRQCLEQTYRVDPYYYGSGGTRGDTGDVGNQLLYLNNQRMVRYIPQPGFQGKDAFTFRILVGTQASQVLGTVELYVRECQDPDCAIDRQFLHR